LQVKYKTYFKKKEVS